jgi:hypothetical protein
MAGGKPRPLVAGVDGGDAVGEVDDGTVVHGTRLCDGQGGLVWRRGVMFEG